MCAADVPGVLLVRIRILLVRIRRRSVIVGDSRILGLLLLDIILVVTRGSRRELAVAEELAGLPVAPARALRSRSGHARLLNLLAVLLGLRGGPGVAEKLARLFVPRRAPASLLLLARLDLLPQLLALRALLFLHLAVPLAEVDLLGVASPSSSAAASASSSPSASSSSSSSASSSASSSSSATRRREGFAHDAHLRRQALGRGDEPRVREIESRIGAIRISDFFFFVVVVAILLLLGRLRFLRVDRVVAAPRVVVRHLRVARARGGGYHLPHLLRHHLAKVGRVGGLGRRRRRRSRRRPGRRWGESRRPGRRIRTPGSPRAARPLGVGPVAAMNPRRRRRVPGAAELARRSGGGRDGGNGGDVRGRLGDVRRHRLRRRFLGLVVGVVGVVVVGGVGGTVTERETHAGQTAEVHRSPLARSHRRGHRLVK